MEKTSLKDRLLPNQRSFSERALARAQENAKKNGFRFAAVLGYKEGDENGKPVSRLWVIDKDLTKYQLAASLRSLARGIGGS